MINELAKDLDERLGQIAGTLGKIAAQIRVDAAGAFTGTNAADLEQGQQLIEDLRAYNALQKDHLGSFIDIDKARTINNRYIERFTQSGASGQLPLLTTQFWVVDADRLKLLTDYTAKNGKRAKIVRIYPGIVTQEEDDTMKPGETRLTLIFTALDDTKNPIRGGNLSDEIKDRIRQIQPPGSTGEDDQKIEDQFDVLEEIGTCNAPPPCPSL